MNAKVLRRLCACTLSIMVAMAMTLSVSTVASAAPDSPFLGQWQATDVDGSDMTLAIGGNLAGPLQITWRDNDIAYCRGTPGILRGTGLLNSDDPNLLDADMQLECFRTGESLDLQVTWRYHSGTNTLSSRINLGAVTIWHRPGRPQAPPSGFNLRVNYGDDWVESFYDAGHTAWVTVTAEDGTLKATIEMMTEPKDYWGGESGFQSLDSVWNDADGSPMENPPDILPNDWVFGWMDNGASARVQIGDISGAIDLEDDSVQGTILAPWITTGVTVECLDWGSHGDPFPNQDGGVIQANGSETYLCSWAGVWDIQPGEHAGVGYFDPGGNWISNDFSTTNPTFVAYLPNAIEGYDWPLGSMIKISINDGEYTDQAQSEQQPGSPEGKTRVLFLLGEDNISLKAGDHITMTDDVVTKDTVVTNLAVTGFDLNARTVSGIFDPTYSGVWVWLYGGELQAPATDGNTWTATFPELTPGAWGGATQWEADGDGTSLDFQVPMWFHITSTEDVIANDGFCTLREAIIASNTNTASGDMSGECPAGEDPGMDIILLDAGQTYSLGRGSTNEEDASDGDLDIQDNGSTTDLVIAAVGDGRATISQDAIPDDRALHNLGATVRIEGVIISGGNAANRGGGGLLNEGVLTLANSVVSGNTAGAGGGVMNVAEMVIADSSIADNTAEYGGGVANWRGMLTLSNTMVSGNSASASSGGIHNQDGGTVAVKDGSLVTGNTAIWDGGGINNWNGTVILENSTVSHNSVPQSGGGINNLNAGTVIVDRTTISENSASGGAGLANWGGTVTFSDSTVDGNTADWGGGILTWGGKLTLGGSTVSNNTAASGDGGIQIKEHAVVTIQSASSILGNHAEWGGGISNWDATLTISASSISGNSADQSGGGILNKDGGITSVLNGSLISNNSATYEGGISNWGGSTLIVDASTISNNYASGSGGGVGNLGTMTVTGSALLDNTSPGEGDAVFSAVDVPGATSITDSCIVGNGNTAVFNPYSAVQNAVGNWWGDPYGPSGIGPGLSGDSVGANIDFSNWLLEVPSICK